MKPPSRQLGVFDSMILVAAIAFGLGWTRFQLDATSRRRLGALIDRRDFETNGQFTTMHGLAVQGAYWAGVVAPIVVTLAIGLLIVGLFRGRMKRGHLLRRPGMAACVAVTTTLILEAVRHAIYYVQLGYFASKQFWDGYNAVGMRFFRLQEVLRPAEMGMAVAATWITLHLSGRFRPEPSTTDQLGRTIGVYWITFMFLYWVAVY